MPHDHFDENRQGGNSTVAAKAVAYTALWSWRPPTWRVYDPAVNATNGMVQPFDLVAEGGPDNVWIVEVGTRDEDGDLDAFLDARDEPLTGVIELSVPREESIRRIAQRAAPRAR